MLFSLLANTFFPALFIHCNCLLWMILQIKVLTFSGRPISPEYCETCSPSVHSDCHICHHQTLPSVCFRIKQLGMQMDTESTSAITGVPCAQRRRKQTSLETRTSFFQSYRPHIHSIGRRFVRCLGERFSQSSPYKSFVLRKKEGEENTFRSCRQESGKFLTVRLLPGLQMM